MRKDMKHTADVARRWHDLAKILALLTVLLIVRKAEAALMSLLLHATCHERAYYPQIERFQ